MKKLKLDELGRISIEEFKSIEKIPVVVLLDNVRSLHNVGSVFRSADSFCVEKIFLTGITGTPPHREIQKTALGATESVQWEYAENGEAIVKKLKLEGYQIVIVEQTTTSLALQQFEPKHDTRYCLIFGNEVNGVGDNIIQHADLGIEIPQAGTKHSLNISVCAGIVLWEVFRRLKL
jgi:tRNA G18 (ribose-2'-O)-methylase SpoU